MNKEIISQQIEELQKELDFLNRTIIELNKLVFYYENLESTDANGIFLDIIKNDDDTNTAIATSYHYNVESYTMRKQAVEEQIKKLQNFQSAK